VTSPTRRTAAVDRPRAQSPFASDVKHELALQLPARRCCQLSELQGFLAAAPVTRGGGQLSFRVAGNIAARKAVRLAGLLESDRSDDDKETEGRGHFVRGSTSIRPSYRVTVSVSPGEPLGALAASPVAPSRHCCTRAFLRGAYLVGGSVSVTPSGYHLEIAFASAAGAAAAAEALAALGIRTGGRSRGRRRMLYVKSSEDLVTAFKLMGASHAVLQFENDRILREMRAQANRQANTETANLRRVVANGLRQTRAARRLRASGILQAQPRALREIASVRLAMPAASLEQIATRLGLSKSAVNARLRRLVAVAQEAGLEEAGLVDLN
jgi:DNA-binding transcriptional regulator WhiA